MMMLLPVVVALVLLSSCVIGGNTSSYYYKHWCGSRLQYLDDKYCMKLFPSNSHSQSQREWKCPIPSIDSTPAGFQPEVDFNEINVDTSTLSGIISTPQSILQQPNLAADLNLCMVITKRVASKSQLDSDSNTNSPSVVNKYLCYGEHSKVEPYETWSSSKIYALANAAGKLHSIGNETQCSNSHWKYGIDSLATTTTATTTTSMNTNTNTNKNTVPLGDLATIICSYDHTQNYTSNSLASYFHDIGWRQRIHDEVIHQWLLGGGSGGGSSLSLGGNYGEASPSSLTFQLQQQQENCVVDPDPNLVIYSNTLTALAAVELTRRLVLHRDLPLAMQYPSVEWNDIQQILYGSGKESLLFNEQLWGGMTADTAIFLQTALQNANVLNDGYKNKNDDQWRIFSKLGAGWSTSRNRGEIITSGYACINGIEVTIHARGSVDNDTALLQAQKVVKHAVDQAIAFAKKEFVK